MVNDVTSHASATIYHKGCISYAPSQKSGCYLSLSSIIWSCWEVNCKYGIALSLVVYAYTWLGVRREGDTPRVEGTRAPGCGTLYLSLIMWKFCCKLARIPLLSVQIELTDDGYPV